MVCFYCWFIQEFMQKCIQPKTPTNYGRIMCHFFYTMSQLMYCLYSTLSTWKSNGDFLNWSSVWTNKREDQNNNQIGPWMSCYSFHKKRVFYCFRSDRWECYCNIYSWICTYIKRSPNLFVIHCVSIYSLGDTTIYHIW